MMKWRFPQLALICLFAAACASAGATPASGQAGTAAAPDSLPTGLGTLKQDEVTVSLRSGALLLKVTPLSEQVTRLLAPDTYTRLHGLAQSRLAEAQKHAGRAPELFLVSFFSYQPDVPFQPEDVQLFHQGQQLRPVSILPITTGWGRQLLAQQESQTAVYAFDGPIDYDQPITLRYGLEESEAWRNLLDRLRSERNKVLSRGK